MNQNLKAIKEKPYDAIVVGTGISGGWTAKVLTENGLKTLILERGRNISHGDYPTTTKDPWDLPHYDQISAEEAQHFKKQMRTGYTVWESTKHWWVKDTDQPERQIILLRN